MGCIFSADALDDGDSVYESLLPSGEVYVFVPGFRLPLPIDFTELLKGSVSAELTATLQSLRSRVVNATGRNELRERRLQDGNPGELDLEKALNDYLPVLLGIVNGGEKFSTGIEYPWINVEDERKDVALGSGYYELLSVLHLLGTLALHEANVCLTPRPPADAYNPKATDGMCCALHPVFAFGRYISASLSSYKLSDENKRNAIEILLKAASYFECAINSVLPNTPDEIKAMLPADLTEAMLKSLEQQALGQAVELQLGFAIDNIKASLAVRRRLACEQVELWEMAIEKLACVPSAGALRDKHILFLKWKLAESKAAAYYFHALIIEEGEEANSHAESVSCLKAAQAHLKESRKACTEFNNMEPLTRAPPLWGHVKFLAEKIPGETSSRERELKEHFSQEKYPETTPNLPEFIIALEADPFHLPPVDAAWNKEQGFEARPSISTPHVSSFFQSKEHQPSARSDLRRAAPLAPPLSVSETLVEV